MLPDLRQSLLTVGLLVALFCAFFWAGFFAGRSLAVQHQPPGAPSAEPAVEQLRVSLPSR